MSVELTEAEREALQRIQAAPIVIADGDVDQKALDDLLLSMAMRCLVKCFHVQGGRIYSPIPKE